MERSRDTLFNGRLTCMQHTAGYRFSVDAILAAHFQVPCKGASLLDLGAGCGVISIIAMYRWAGRIREICALEVQPQLAELALCNFRQNGFSDKCRVVTGDFRNILQYVPAESFSQVICNPPYYRRGSGRTSGDIESLHARHQILADLHDTVGAAAAAVKNRGTVVFVYPAEGLGELLSELSQAKLEPKRLQCVYSYPDAAAAACLVLVAAVKNAGHGVKVMPPFYIYTRKNGEFSPQMKKIYLPNQTDLTDKSDCLD